MTTFNFPYHTVTDSYPESSTRVQFGKGYTFAAKPKGPDQIVFRLFFNAMSWYFDGSGNPISSTNPTYNIMKLIEFYETYRLYGTFSYTHPRLGSVTVRFKNPLETPKSILGGNGVVEPFEIQLVLQP